MLSRKDWQGIRMISGVVVVLLAAFGIGAWLQSKPKPADDNCVGVPHSSTIIVIDNSQAITEQTRREIIARSQAYIRDSVRNNERVSVFRISASSADSLVPVLSLCKPPNSGNALIEDERAIARRFRDRFEVPLRTALEQPPTSSEASPIAEAILDLSLSEYLRADTNSVVLFSDLLENTPNFSLYGCKSGDDAIRAFRESRRGARERPRFRNARITLHVVPRTSLSANTTPSCRDRFWMWFFGDNEGGSLVPDYLPGK